MGSSGYKTPPSKVSSSTNSTSIIFNILWFFFSFLFSKPKFSILLLGCVLCIFVGKFLICSRILLKIELVARRHVDYSEILELFFFLGLMVKWGWGGDSEVGGGTYKVGGLVR
ncbi:hypothetical protein ACH5RR_013675 [Cinchona calisaya]|uniref:Transmembrane protein n=1 Tax=Cinchona calisaya TaxID=153742 RepID=A0ABD3A6H7_9GENT